MAAAADENEAVTKSACEVTNPFQKAKTNKDDDNNKDTDDQRPKTHRRRIVPLTAVVA